MGIAGITLNRQADAYASWELPSGAADQSQEIPFPSFSDTYVEASRPVVIAEASPPSPMISVRLSYKKPSLIHLDRESQFQELVPIIEQVINYDQALKHKAKLANIRTLEIVINDHSEASGIKNNGYQVVASLQDSKIYVSVYVHSDFKLSEPTGLLGLGLDYNLLGNPTSKRAKLATTIIQHVKTKLPNDPSFNKWQIIILMFSLLEELLD